MTLGRKQCHRPAITGAGHPFRWDSQRAGKCTISTRALGCFQTHSTKSISLHDHLAHREEQEQNYHLVMILSFFLKNKCFPIKQYRCWCRDWKYNEENKGFEALLQTQNPRELGGEKGGRGTFDPGTLPWAGSSEPPPEPGSPDLPDTAWRRQSHSQESQTLRIRSYQLKVTIRKPPLFIFTKLLKFKLG